MNCETPSANFCPEDARNPELLVSRSTILEGHAKALRLFVGRGRRHTVRELALATGVPERAIEAAKCGIDDPEHRPLKPEYLASIAKFLKAPFVSIYLEASGLGAFELMDGQAPLPRVLTSSPAQEDIAEERKRLIRRLAELEEVQ